MEIKKHSQKIFVFIINLLIVALVTMGIKDASKNKVATEEAEMADDSSAVQDFPIEQAGTASGAIDGKTPSPSASGTVTAVENQAKPASTVTQPKSDPIATPTTTTTKTITAPTIKPSTASTNTTTAKKAPSRKTKTS